MAFADLVTACDRAALEHLGGTTVVYRPQHEDPVEVEGIFDSQYVLVRPGEAGNESVGPALFVRLADLPVHPDDDEPQVEIGDTVYTVRERQPDGMGGMRLLLYRSE